MNKKTIIAVVAGVALLGLAYWFFIGRKASIPAEATGLAINAVDRQSAQTLLDAIQSIFGASAATLSMEWAMTAQPDKFYQSGGKVTLTSRIMQAYAAGIYTGGDKNDAAWQKKNDELYAVFYPLQSAIAKSLF